jgi:acylphosphatase
MARYHVSYYGRVQGVGFRATVRRIAAAHSVSGFVQNEPDGQVVLEVQGTSVIVDRFLAEVQRQFLGFITDEERAVVTDIAGDSGFVVHY